MLFPSIFTDNFFDDFFPFERSARKTASTGITTLGMMHTDVLEQKDGYLVTIDLPGFKKEEVKAQLKEGYLTITASRSDSDETNVRYLRRERYMGTVTRSFYVGEELTEQDIKARFEDGLLKISLPKKEAKKEIPQERYIDID